MENLKFSTLTDIKDFLKEIGYNWNGYISLSENIKLATIEDIFEYGATLIVTKLNKTEVIKLPIYVTDLLFEVEKENPEKKYDSYDYSVLWQAFMLKRKDKNYAKHLYLSALKHQKETTENFKTQMNLLRKKAQALSKEQKISEAKHEALKHNIANQLTAEEMAIIEKSI